MSFIPGPEFTLSSHFCLKSSTPIPQVHYKWLEERKMHIVQVELATKSQSAQEQLSLIEDVMEVGEPEDDGGDSSNGGVSGVSGVGVGGVGDGGDELGYDVEL